MKIKESLDQTKFPTRHLKDIGIEYIRKMEECLEDEEAFMKMIEELCDKSIWLAVTTKDLYYWIEILNKVDILLADTISEVKKLVEGSERCGKSEYEEKIKDKTQRLNLIITFSFNLLKESSSRTIYNSVDRLVDVMKLIDDLDILYLCLETIYTLIKKSCITGKFTKAHECPELGLLKFVYILSLGFNCLSDEKLDLVESLDYKKVMGDNELRLQKFHRIKKGNREVPSLSYFKMPIDELAKVKIENNNQYTSRNIASQVIKDNNLSPETLDVVAMKILFIQKLLVAGQSEINLVKINKIILKAKSVFIHLSSAEEEDTGITLKFIKDHQFNSFIPDLLNYCTIEAPSELHCVAIEILHSYLCAAIVHTETVNIYRQSAHHILQSLGVVNMNSRPLHKILSD